MKRLAGLHLRDTDFAMLARAAAARDTSPSQLAKSILHFAVNDHLIDAIIDTDSSPRRGPGRPRKNQSAPDEAARREAAEIARRLAAGDGLLDALRKVAEAADA